MSSDTPPAHEAVPTSATRARDLTRARVRMEVVVTTVCAAVALSAAVWLDAMERFVEWAQQHEEWQVDETFSLFVVFSVALAVFATRRWRETSAAIRALSLSESELRASERRLERLFDSSPFPILVVSQADRTLLACNDEFQRVTGHLTRDVIGKSIVDVGLWAHPEIGLTIRERIIAEKRIRNEPVEFRTKAGVDHPALLSVETIDYNGQRALLAAFNDITERRALENQLQFQAFHDGLTGLPNRALLRLRLEHALARSPRSGSRPIVLFLDLDDFKRVNDTHGHGKGDELLIAVSRRLLACLRAEDTCARLGGDEFAILLEDTISTEDGARLADRLVPALQAPYELSGTVAQVGVSIGVAAADVGTHPDDMMRNADIAMYLSKSGGKGRTTVYEPAMHAEVVERLAIESDLLLAIERGEMVVHYQPIVNIATSEILGAEALLRWNHPVRGPIAPATFIPIAEQTGAIIAIGQWVLREACRDAREMQQRHWRSVPLRVSVNVSGRQIVHPDIVQHVASALSESGLDASSLVLEITETVLVHNEVDTIERLNALKRLGVRLAIDDFGTGYSSLAYLQRFPVDILKIDKSFTDRLGTGVEESPIARAIVALGNTISLQTIAEGIETVEQWERLRELGCELGQGFYMARPEDLASLDALLSNCDASVGAIAAHA